MRRRYISDIFYESSYVTCDKRHMLNPGLVKSKWNWNCIRIFCTLRCIWNSILPFLSCVPWTSYQKRNLRIAHAPRMPGTFSPPSTLKESASKRSRHASRHVRHVRVVLPVGIAHPRWWGKRSRHSWRMRSPQFYISCKRPIDEIKQHKVQPR